MSILSTSIKFIRRAAVLALLPWLACSCQWITGDYDDEIDIGTAPNYINITISVSAENNAPTRAPLGGEYGDGTEKGIDRENKVSFITLIFYQDDNGINTTSDDAEVLCVKQYSVRPYTNSDLPNSHTHKTGESSNVQNNEVLYTTGDQKLEETTLQAGQSYKVLVVANAIVNVTVGEKIKDVRDKVASNIYTGNGIGINASDFVMTSEGDATVTLENPTIDTSTGENRFIYYFNCIHIERLSARIDYCTSGASYNGTYGGYVYSTGNSDFYVVTKVTPFNLNNGSEYLFKRVQDAWPSTATTYLGDESTSNYVVDPNTANKNNSQTLNYLSPIAENMNNGYTQAMNNLSTDQKFTPTGGSETIIIAYPRENTLMPSSYLKKYATGLAFEVKYYASASVTTPVTRVYYHYLRHQGELSTGSYQARQWNELSDEESGSSVPMNYGIVRNNIYRVEISGFTDEGIDLKIKVKKWDLYTHEIIYM